MFWEIDTGKLNGFYKEEKEEEITSICKIEKSNYLIVCNIIGTISFVALPPLINKYLSVFSFQNTDQETG